MPAISEELSVLRSCKPLGEKLFVELLPVQVSKLLSSPQPLHHFDGKVRHGKVIAVGPKVKELWVGDIIVFPAAAGRWVLSDDFRSLEEKEVFGVEEEKTTRV